MGNEINRATRELNVIIVDDEDDACRNLQKTLVEYIDHGINVNSIAHSTAEAERQIALHKPDVVFLDIEMPEENAFDFLDRIFPFNFEVIFVTAYDEYAIRAFRLNAVDYILKPISIEEVSNAVKKARERLAYKQIVEEKGGYSTLLNNIQNKAKPDKIKLKDNTSFDIVDFADILYVEAKGSYSSVCFIKDRQTEKRILTSSTLNEYEDMFPMDVFCRIHRSLLVNCRQVKKIMNGDNCFVLMNNKERLQVSRRRIPDLMLHFKNNNQ